MLMLICCILARQREHHIRYRHSFKEKSYFCLLQPFDIYLKKYFNTLIYFSCNILCYTWAFYIITVKHSKWTPLDIEISKENSYRSRLSKYRRDRSSENKLNL